MSGELAIPEVRVDVDEGVLAVIQAPTLEPRIMRYGLGDHEWVKKIEAVCARHKVKLPQAALRFPLLHPSVVGVIPGAAGPKEVALNVKTMGAKIPQALWKELKAEGLMHKDAPVG